MTFSSVSKRSWHSCGAQPPVLAAWSSSLVAQLRLSAQTSFGHTRPLYSLSEVVGCGEGRLPAAVTWAMQCSWCSSGPSRRKSSFWVS